MKKRLKSFNYEHLEAINIVNEHNSRFTTGYMVCTQNPIADILQTFAEKQPKKEWNENEHNLDLELDTTNQDYKADSYKAASHYSYYYCNCFSVSHK